MPAVTPRMLAHIFTQGCSKDIMSTSRTHTPVCRNLSEWFFLTPGNGSRSYLPPGMSGSLCIALVLFESSSLPPSILS